MTEPINLWQAFRRVALHRRPAPALVTADREISFGELESLALRAAALLRERGLGRGHVVALQRRKTVETYALMLGALRLGAIYACLDPKNPPDRTHRMLARLRPRLLVSNSDALNPFGDLIVHSLAGRAEGWPSPLDAGERDHETTGQDPAYIMFTSGSTGEPKGAVIPHQGVLALMRWGSELLSGLSDHRFSAINPLHFDNSVFDLYCGLMNGAALAPIETGELNDPTDWVKALRRSRANVVFAVPTLFLLLDRLGLLTPESLPDVRYFLFGGEGFPIRQLSDFRTRFVGSARLINVYGPTETSCICSSIEVVAESVHAAGAGFHSLGRMQSNFSYTVLDEEGCTTSPGETGELWIGGPSVGLGYYGDPEQTALRFRQDPRQSEYRDVFYRTGDLVREDQDGALWFGGRVDNQIKFAGHRIELEEIDFAVQSAPGVRRAATVFLKSGDSGELVTAFQADRVVSAIELFEVAREKLPAYMRPSRFVQVQDLPINANGKIDRLRIGAEIGVLAASGAHPKSTRGADLANDLRAIWSDVLACDQFGVNDSFFDLGGTSIMLARVPILIEQRMGLRCTLVDLFAHPTLGQLEAFFVSPQTTPDLQLEAQTRAQQRNEALKRAVAARTRKAQ